MHFFGDHQMQRASSLQRIILEKQRRGFIPEMHPPEVKIKRIWKEELPFIEQSKNMNKMHQFKRMDIKVEDDHPRGRESSPLENIEERRVKVPKLRIDPQTAYTPMNVVLPLIYTPPSKSHIYSMGKQKVAQRSTKHSVNCKFLSPKFKLHSLPPTQKKHLEVASNVQTVPRSNYMFPKSKSVAKSKSKKKLLSQEVDNMIADSPIRQDHNKFLKNFSGQFNQLDIQLSRYNSENLFLEEKKKPQYAADLKYNYYGRPKEIKNTFNINVTQEYRNCAGTNFGVNRDFGDGAFRNHFENFMNVKHNLEK